MPFSQNCEISARRPKKGPPSGQTATYRKTEVIQSYLRIWGTYDPIESGPSDPKKWGLYRRSVSIFYATPMKPPFFQLKRPRLNGIISPPYPEVTLDTFRFLVSGRLAAWWDVFWPPGQILDFGPVPLASKSTTDFGPWSTKLGGTIQATKKMIQIDNSPGPGRNNGETAVFLRFAENPFFLLRKKHPKSAKRLIYLGKGHFLVSTTLPGGG